MKAVEWLRVSTGEQDTSNQQPGITAARDQRGDELAARFEVAASATNGQHLGEWRKVVNLVKSGQAQRVYIWALDRVSREGIPAMFAALHPILKAGGVIVSVREPWLEQDPGSGEWELLVSIAAYMAHKETEKRGERTRAGMETARINGKQIGRPKGRKDSRGRRRSQKRVSL